MARSEKEDPMDHINYKEGIEMLRKARLKASEIHRLERLRSNYAQEEKDQASVYRRLEFIRWLVATGKLTDYIS